MEVQNWKISEEQFEYASEFKDSYTPWAGHKYFGYDLVANTKPSLIVELGTHKGTSLFSFSQAVKNNKLETSLHGIDTWEGDLNTGKYEGDEVLSGVQSIQNKFYKGQDINLMRMLFDDALKDFKDDSIDVLHIDGLHTYEGVKHDYNTWKSKVKEDGIILFHDIVVEKENFGVKQFWAEIKNEFEFTLSFPHSNGLGVGFKKKPNFDFSNVDQFYKEYLLKSYNEVRYDLYHAAYGVRELAEIKESKYWGLKEQVKKIVGK
jgi:hypothetical protein